MFHRPLSELTSQLPPLPPLQAPSVDAEHGVDAAQYLWQLVGLAAVPAGSLQYLECGGAGSSRKDGHALRLLQEGGLGPVIHMHMLRRRSSEATLLPAVAQVGGNRRLTGHVERRERLAGAGKSWGAQVGGMGCRWCVGVAFWWTAQGGPDEWADSCVRSQVTLESGLQPET